ncbi:SNF2 family N-terminal domain-containing protein, partial [Helicostylum pulchrum]
MSPPTPSSKGYSIPSNSRPISSFFTPAKKPEPISTGPKVTIKSDLKSSNLRTHGSPFSPSNYVKSDLDVTSTDKLSQNLADFRFNSSPLRDLNTPTTADNMAVDDDNTPRVLRKRKPRPQIIIDSSEEEDEEEEKEDKAPVRKPKRAKIVSDSESSDDEDEAYVDQNEKMNKTYDDESEQVNIERIQRIYPNKSVAEIRQGIYETGSAVQAISMFYRQDSSSQPFRKRLPTDEDIIQLNRDKLSKMQRDKLVLRFFNTATSKEIQDITGCKAAIADIVIEQLRPFDNMDNLEDKLRSTKGTSAKFINSCREMMDGYTAVDQIIEKIENMGGKLRNILNIWQGLTTESTTVSPGAVEEDVEEDKSDEKAGTHLMHLDVDPTVDKSDPEYIDAMEGYLAEQPKYVNKEMTLKDYQILGVNWMLLLYRKNISGILADEMGLGKTAQVIAFLGRLFEMGESGPHLVIVPSSTIENWLREFERFCPKLTVRLYHGSIKERDEQRYDLIEDKGDYQVIVTTYNIATSNAEDRSFLKKLKCRSMILDEGHMIKNCTSARYKFLMKISVPFRLLLTGTPLQNNLQELVSLLIFIMPDTFAQYEEEVRSIFKIRVNAPTKDEKKGQSGKGTETAVQVLSRERITRAKKMMTPFVLRRKKQDVLKDLPSKKQIVEICTMTPNQKQLYSDIILKSKKTLDKQPETKKKSAMNAQFENMSNIIVHLRKAADHPLLFRKVYTDDLLRQMTKEIMRDVKYWDSTEEYIYEDMTVMSDFELNRLCKDNKTIKHHQLKNDEWMDSGKIEKLKVILPECKAKKEKVLIFSQFTRMLDILELVMSTLNVTYVRLDGETKVMERQNVIDDFNEDESIDVFLLSTKAGGFGINLTSANVVVLYDLDFNPQNDRQAEDRAHRVGQTKDVRIIKLISKDSVEEYILKMADIKLRLDKRISAKEGDAIENQEYEDEEDSEHQKQSLQSMIREAFIQADRLYGA